MYKNEAKLSNLTLSYFLRKLSDQPYHCKVLHENFPRMDLNKGQTIKISAQERLE